MTGPLWSRLLLTWSKPFTDAVLNNPATATFLPLLKKDQQWATNMLIQSEDLTDDEEEDWAATTAIIDVRKQLPQTLQLPLPHQLWSLPWLTTNQS